MDPALRAGDVDRQRVVAELQRHYVDGRLDSEELSERVDHALAARTFGDLERLTDDLPKDEPVTEKMPRRQQWWAPFTSLPGVVLLALVGIMIVTWLVWLPSGNAPVWPVLILGGVFIFRGPRRLRRR